jgi:16S rRNA processing protein RimM
MTKSLSRITLATIGAPHGVKGEVRVKSFAAEPMALAAYGTLFAEDGRVFEIERLRPAKGVLVAKFRGIDDRDAAERLKGVSLSVERSALPAPDTNEFYHADLIGLQAVDSTGDPLGSVVAVQNFGAGDILEIASAQGLSLLVPFTKEHVPDIDVAAGRLVVVPPIEVEIETPKEET